MLGKIVCAVLGILLIPALVKTAGEHAVGHVAGKVRKAVGRE